VSLDARAIAPERRLDALRFLLGHVRQHYAETPRLSVLAANVDNIADAMECDDGTSLLVHGVKFMDCAAAEQLCRVLEGEPLACALAGR
jgi:hypothetical protein